MVRETDYNKSLRKFQSARTKWTQRVEIAGVNSSKPIDDLRHYKPYQVYLKAKSILRPEGRDGIETLLRVHVKPRWI